MKDKGTQSKCTLCKKQFKVFVEPEKHNNRSFCEVCLDRTDSLIEDIITQSPCCSAEIWSGATLVVSFTGGPLQDCWVDYPGINGSPGITRQNIPFRPWIIIGKFSLRDLTDDEIVSSVSYWFVENVELREAWELELDRLSREQNLLNKKLTINEEGEVPEDQEEVQRDLNRVRNRIIIAKNRHLYSPEPGEDTELFRRLVRTNRKIEYLQLNCKGVDDEINRLQCEAAEIINERCNRQLFNINSLFDEAIDAVNDCLSKNLLTNDQSK